MQMPPKIYQYREGAHCVLFTDSGAIAFEPDGGRNGLEEDFLPHVFIALPYVVAAYVQSHGQNLIHRNVD